MLGTYRQICGVLTPWCCWILYTTYVMLYLYTQQVPPFNQVLFSGLHEDHAGVLEGWFFIAFITVARGISLLFYVLLGIILLVLVPKPTHSKCWMLRSVLIAHLHISLSFCAVVFYANKSHLFFSQSLVTILLSLLHWLWQRRCDRRWLWLCVINLWCLLCLPPTVS